MSQCCQCSQVAKHSRVIVCTTTTLPTLLPTSTSLAQVLALVEAANQVGGGLLPPEAFYNKLIR
jgi:hypothetical protein